MSTTTVNVDLLRDVLTYITEHPEEHRQEAWATRTSCGTAYCVAGHVVIARGHQIDWASGWTRSDGTQHTDYVASGPYIDDVAALELGLDSESAELLFDGHNDLDDLWRIAAEITDGAITRPAAHAATNPSK